MHNAYYFESVTGSSSSYDSCPFLSLSQPKVGYEVIACLCCEITAGLLKVSTFEFLQLKSLRYSILKSHVTQTYKIGFEMR